MKPPEDEVARWEALLASEGMSVDEPADEPVRDVTDFEAGLMAAEGVEAGSVKTPPEEEDDAPPVDMEGNLHSFLTTDPCD